MTPENSLSPPDEKPERRGKVILDQPLQMYYFTSITLSVFFMIATFFSLLLLAGYRNLTQDWVALTALMVMFSLAPAFGIHSIRHSHRIVGPVYHLEKGMRNILEGNWGYLIHLREGDYFQRAAETFNEMSIHLREKREKWLEIQEELKKLHQTLPEGEQEKLKGLLEKMNVLEP